MTDQAVTALLDHGCINGPIRGIGVALKEGSWPQHDARSATLGANGGTLTLVRNQALIWEPARWAGVAAWPPVYRSGNALADFFTAMREIPKEARIPWRAGWQTPGGTQWTSADNGVVVIDGSVRYELQGLAPVNQWVWRVDGMNRITDDAKVKGPQGPGGIARYTMTPAWLSGPWPGPVGAMLFNVQYGAGATFAPGGWVEHPDTQQMVASFGAAYTKIVRPGNNPDAVPSRTRFKLRITDDEIERWIAARGVKDGTRLATSMRWAAIGLREHGLISYGTAGAYPHLIATGYCNPEHAKGWNDAGLTSQTIADHLTDDLFDPQIGGQLEVAA